MAVPAWKQAILEKKRKQEEEKKKRQDDKEAYIASLPPWKQAKARKKLETDENVTIPPVTKHATVPSVTKYAPVPSQVVAGKPRTTNGTMNCVQEPLSSKTVSDVARVFSVQDKLLVEASSLPEPHRHIESEMLEVKPCSDDGKATNAFRLNRPKMKKSASQEVDETDPQFQAMPKWKQELLRRRKSKEEQTKLPGSKQQTEVKQSETRTEKAKQDHKHGVVSSSENNDSPKLIQKEGKTLKPPVFNMASKWANITEDDPDFKKLPSWKQAVIRRRKEDATKRTAPESPVTERKVLENSISIITPWSPSNEVPLSNAAENTLSNEVPHWKKKLKHTAISFPSLQLPKHENEPLFASQLHNKKAQKLLRRFSQPSGSTSNPVDDTAGVTMIDEESDDDFPISSLGRKEVSNYYAAFIPTLILECFTAGVVQ